MNPKIYLISLFVVFILVGGVVMARNQLFLPKRNITSSALTDKSLGWKFPVDKFPAGQVTESGAFSEFRKAGGAPRGLPVRLQIPIIGVDSAIEDAYITPDGRMDVPAGTVNVAWFAIGTIPGQKGSAVIGGHFGIDDGVPKVFYNLSKLIVGDKVYIVDDYGNTLAFMVRSIRVLDRNADASTVFYSNDGLAHLNVITCEGEWNKVNDTYPDRRVVFTDSIPSEGPVGVVETQPTNTLTVVTPSLPLTAETDVVETQRELTFFQRIISGILDSFSGIGR
jgi:LPXTG-site transpeptidase (sortase) family protein